MLIRPHWILAALLLVAPSCGKRHAVGFDATSGLDAALVPDLPPRSDLPPIPDSRIRELGPKPDARPPDLAMAPDLPPPDLQAPDGPPPASWVEVATPPGVLNDVWGSSSTDVFAVGKAGLVMRYQGGGWSKMGNTTTMDLEGVWGASASQIFAVGDVGDLFFDGSSWQSSGYNQSFVDVWGAAGGTLVFGISSVSPYNQIRYKQISAGSAYWSSVVISNLTQESLNALWLLSDGELFAVGDNGTIVRCKSSSCTTGSGSGTGWTVMTSGTTSHLTDVWGFSSTEVFAVGLGGTILRYDGTSWSKMTTGTSTYFYGVWGSSPSDVYAVGHPLFKQDESIFHYDGVSWSKMPPPKVSYPNAVWGASATEVFVVGNFNILKLKP